MAAVASSLTGAAGRTSADLVRGKTPSVDILNRENEFLIRAELPDVEKKEITITIANGTMTLGTSVSTEEKKEKGESFRREICRSSYRRTVELPETVREDTAKATFRNGVLVLTVPEQEKTKRSAIAVE